MAIMFADVVGYSKLNEAQVQIYHNVLLEALAQLLESLSKTKLISSPATQNTWGDAVYFVFSRVSDAGAVALLFSDLVQTVSWDDFGLPSDLNVRISLHAAPVSPVFDPIAKTKVKEGREEHISALLIAHRTFAEFHRYAHFSRRSH